MKVDFKKSACLIVGSSATPIYTRTKKVDISKFADVFLLEIKMAKQLSVNEWKYLFEKYEKYR
ncbi:hypothetical protein V5E85_04250, partial [Mycoplasmopsis bovis]